MNLAATFHQTGGNRGGQFFDVLLVRISFDIADIGRLV